MKKIIPAIIIFLLIAGAGYWWVSREPAQEVGWLGYIEGEALMIAAPVPGMLARLDVQRGQNVTAGAPLFALNDASSAAEMLRLQAQLAGARAMAADLARPRQRPAELAVTQAQAASARAQLERTQKDFSRIDELTRQGFATRAQRDAALQAVRQARAALAGAQASRASGELKGRDGQQQQAAANVAAAQAAIAAQRRRTEEIAPVAPADALVEQTYFLPGEWVGANMPVVRLLEPGRVRVRFFVPETELASLRLGESVSVDCDGCAEAVSATIRYISPRAEFTPPVIYSEHARTKLVFMVEAQPANGLEQLHPGLPVQVSRP